MRKERPIVPVYIEEKQPGILFNDIRKGVRSKPGRTISIMGFLLSVGLSYTPLFEQSVKPAESTTEEYPPSPLDTYTTSHGPDLVETGSHQSLLETAELAKQNGLNGIRFDWRWKLLQPTQNRTFDESYFNRLTDFTAIQNKENLEPTVVLSSIPDWAMELYKTNKDEFFKSWQNYVEQVKDRLEKVPGPKVEVFQILNQVNHFIYTPIDIQDLPKLCEITRKILSDYNPDAKFMITLSASNLLGASEEFGRGHDIFKYLDGLEKLGISKYVDRIAIDDYLGSWDFLIAERYAHNKWNIPLDIASVITLANPLIPIGPIVLKQMEENIIKGMFADVKRTGRIFEKVAALGVEYEVAEVGFPSSLFLTKSHSEKMQSIYYETFTNALIKLLHELKAKGVALPKRVGFYQQIDEDADILGLDWGAYYKNGDPKLVITLGILNAVIRQLEGQNQPIQSQSKSKEYNQRLSASYKQFSPQTRKNFVRRKT